VRAAVEAQRPRGHHGRMSADLDYGEGMNVCLWHIADVPLALCRLMTQSRHFARHAHFSNARCKGATPDHVVKLDLHVEGAPG
jgi:hypothetical protein